MGQRLAHVTFLVRDYDEALRFFVESLGFDMLADTALEPGTRWVLVAPGGGAGGSVLLLARAVTPEQQARVGDQAGGRVFLFLQTDDFWRDHAAMRERGVRFVEKPRQEAYGTVAVFLDLYGNKWDLIEPRPPQACPERERAMLDQVMIRPAVPSDAARLAELSGVLGYPVAARTLAERLTRLLASSEHLVLVATLPSSRVVGWVHGAEQELLETGRRCEICGLVVDAEHRQRGVGRQLVLAIEAWAAARGLEQVAVRSNVARAESHPFYERLGYDRVKTQYAYAKRLPPTGER